MFEFPLLKRMRGNCRREVLFYLSATGASQLSLHSRTQQLMYPDDQFEHQIYLQIPLYNLWAITEAEGFVLWVFVSEKSYQTAKPGRCRTSKTRLLRQLFAGCLLVSKTSHCTHYVIGTTLLMLACNLYNKLHFQI